MFSNVSFFSCCHILPLYLTHSQAACSLRLSTLDSLDRPWAGLVELFTNDEWGRVCAEDWGLKEAEVVCRNLGFRAVLETRNQVFDPPSDLYWLAGELLLP